MADNNFPTTGRLTSLANSTRKLLKPLVAEPKYRIALTLMTNWKNIVSGRYHDYCKFERIVLNGFSGQAIVYVISYNSSASFYLSNNSQYIVARMNSTLGQEFVTRIFVREVPTTVNRPIGEQEPKRELEIQNLAKANRGKGNSLEDSLEELGKCF
jgi:hypothetical protein